MKLRKNEQIIISLLSGLYLTAVSWFIDPFTFLNTTFTGVSYAILFLVASGSLFLWIQVLKRFPVGRLQRIGSIATFIIIYGILAFLIALFYDIKNGKLLFFMSFFVISSLLPTIVMTLWILLQNVESKIRIIRENSTDEEPEIFQLTNNSGKVLLEIPLDQIICFEANDNYVTTYYITEGDDLKKTMDRMSLKQVEIALDDLKSNFYRVHKSYIVNPGFIISVKGKAQAYKLEINHFNKEIPVSRSFDIDQLKG